MAVHFIGFPFNMRILVNRGGQQLGPFSLDELRAAIAAGKVSHQDLAWWEGAPSWVNVAQVPGLSLTSPSIPNLPAATLSTENPAPGLATTSLVLGIASVLGLFCFTGIPAVICGHMALARQKKAGYQNTGIAIGGLVTGYLGTALIVLVALLAAIAVPSYARIKEQSLLMQSMSNAKQIVAACNLYQADHNGEFPPSLDAIGDYQPSVVVLTDPLAAKLGPKGYWYSQPSRNAPGNTTIVASRGQTKGGKRALAHKDGSASSGSFTIPLER